MRSRETEALHTQRTFPDDLLALITLPHVGQEAVFFGKLVLIEPTKKPNLAEAVPRPSAAEQLAARVAGHGHCPVLLRTPHRWRKLDEPRDV